MLRLSSKKKHQSGTENFVLEKRSAFMVLICYLWVIENEFAWWTLLSTFNDPSKLDYNFN